MSTRILLKNSARFGLQQHPMDNLFAFKKTIGHKRVITHKKGDENHGIEQQKRTQRDRKKLCVL